MPTQTSPTEAHTTPLQVKFSKDIEMIVAELSKGPDSVVERICDSLIGDLDILCEHVREHGTSSINSLREVTVSHRRNPERFAGHYVGYGLGGGWLELGFLEKPVIEALQRRFTSLKEDFVQSEPHSVDTMFGSVSIHGWFYMTEKGAYQISHTYTWFVQKRIDIPK